MRSRRRLLRAASTLLSSGLLATLLVAVGVQQAHDRADRPRTAPTSENTYLCYEYAGCRSKGYSDAGYGAVNSRMYWQMYPGHNCTNYAAYRMIKAGMPNQRPWSGGGNASEWGLEMRNITDQTPAVGAIAWWGRYDNGSGSAGHVAYVERVEGSSTIVVSQDSWGGTFSWRRISKDSGRWPTGFIHFRDAQQKVENTKRPVITGTPEVGSSLRATTGRWKPASTHTFQWYADGEKIDGARNQTFVPTVDLVGKQIRVKVRARADDYSSTVVATQPTEPVAKAHLLNTAKPVLSGDPVAGSTLKVTTGTWTPRPDATVTTWYADDEQIEGATGSSYVVPKSMVGKKIHAKVAVTKTGYRKSRALTAPTAPIAAGAVEVTHPTTVSGALLVGRTLRAEPGTVTPSGNVTTAYQWLRDGTPIARATNPTYQLSTADLGAEVTVRVKHTRAGYAPAAEEVRPGAKGAVVRAKTAATLTTEVRGRTVTVGTAVTSRGAATVTGKVTLSVGREKRTVRLQDGRASVRFEKLPVGRWAARVWYHPTTTMWAVRKQKQVRVTR